MNKELTDRLYNDFPELYEQHTWTIQEACMPWGFEHGDGWFDLIYKLSKDLMAVSKKVRAVHQGKSEWLESCPKCMQKPLKEGLSDGAAGRELGFNKTPYGRKTGVASCSSFTWCMPPEEFLKKNVKIRGWNVVVQKGLYEVGEVS